MTHPHRGHETATYLMQTGREPGGGKVFPAIGAVIAMFKSKEYRGDLPPYVILTIAKGRFSEIGFLNERYSPLVTGGNPAAAKFIVDGIVPPGGLSREELSRRFELLDRLDSFGKDDPAGHAEFKAFDAAGKEARRTIEGDAAKVFDLSLESPEMRKRYGENTLGQSFLTARRLVEAGVPYITINAQGWDTHKRHFETMKTKAAEMDRATTALLTDLHEKGCSTARSSGGPANSDALRKSTGRPPGTAAAITIRNASPRWSRGADSPAGKWWESPTTRRRRSSPGPSRRRICSAASTSSAASIRMVRCRIRSA